MKESVIIEIAKLMINISLKKMTKNQKVLTILNKVNKLVLAKDDFETIYIHTLVEYGVDKPDKDLVKFFSSSNITEAIKQEKHSKDKIEFEEICKLVFDDFQGLESFHKFASLADEIDEFISTYDAMVETCAKPFLLKMYNQQKEDSFKQTFEFQSEKYLRHLIKEFNKEFPKNKYIEQKGEIREIVINFSKRQPIGKMNKKTKLSKRKRISVKRTGSNLNIMDFKDVIVSPLKPIDKFINDWINDDSQNFLVIMGEYGTGKTTLCKHITKELVDSYFDKKTKIINDKHRRKVILFNLRNFKSEDVEKYIIAELNENGIKDFSTPDLFSRIENNELIFIFDGFDEMTQRIDTEEKKANFLQIEKLIKERKNSKVILTSREEYFTFDEELNEVFRNNENDNYKIIYLNLFDDEQIKAYLKTHTTNAQFYLDKIQEIYDLSDLAPRPVLLDFIVKYLPKLIEEKGEDIIINASDLYRTGIKTELEKKSREVSFLNKKLPTQKRLLLLQKLSVWMYENDTLIIDTRIIKETLNLKKFFDVKEDYELLKYLNMFLNFTFLTKESDYTFRISHRSFRDYLTATELVKEINSGKINVFSKHQTSAEINHFISEMKPDRNKLLKIVQEEKDITEENKWQKSNAINLILKIDNPKYDLSLDFNFKHILVSYNHLTNISILKEVHNLIEFGLDNCLVKSIEPLAGMKKLSHLYLNDNQIGNIEPLKSLNKLSHLKLHRNQIKDIGPLKELKSLISLYLGSNNINDISALQALKQLTELSLNDNQISNIESLKSLNKLSHLKLHGNQIKDIRSLKELKSLTSLYLESNNINDISTLQELKQLTELSLSDNQISNITSLQELKKLKKLNLSNNKINNIESLQNLHHLVELKLSDNEIEDVIYLSELTQLHMLSLNKNKISNIKPLWKFKKLNYLDLENNMINDITILAGFEYLTELILPDNYITNIEPLKDIENLEYLDLNNNQIKNVESLINSNELEYLVLKNNLIQDIQPLKELNNLRTLDLRHNQISDIEPLKELKNLLDLFLFGNPLDKSQIEELEEALPDTYVIFDLDPQNP
ncbi:MAG: leucine-rich repeat domain-containing protein [Candidatus Cloacimonetes bacterium]|nr:leucine-rich repeat domain-containing protein [Candidatus Cloacimonadota bacterium]